jgi:NAD(P)-dependent dehydrogenase (short-subunit alcohol dehydrogenase family)
VAAGRRTRTISVAAGQAAALRVKSGMKHALVVGGTGMLRGVCHHLASRTRVVSVVARHPDRIASDFVEFTSTLNQLTVDYRDNKALRQALMGATEVYGPIGLAVCWIHGSAPEAPFTIAEVVGVEPCRYVHVLGSAVADPTRCDVDRLTRFGLHPHIGYHEVILGFVREGRRSRWLTDAEITEGVIAAIESEAKRMLVGTVEPWAARPS